MPTAGWTSDPQPADGFAISYPPGWAPKATATAGPDHVYFATAGAQAPLEMGPDDVWLTVQVQTPAPKAPCKVDLPGQDGGSIPTEVQGRKVDLKLRDPHQGQVEPTWKAYAVTADSRHCYVLWFVTLNKDTRTRELGTMQQILAGFQPTPVGPAPPSPAPSPSASPTPPSPAPAASPSPSPAG